MKIAKKWRAPLITVAVLSLLYYIVVVAAAISIYKHQTQNSFTRFAERIFPYPAAFVGHDVVSLSRFRHEVALRSFYAQKNNVQATQAETEALVMTQLTNRILYTTTLKEHDIAIKESDVDKRLEEIYQQAGGKEKVEQFLRENYGPSVDLEDFRLWTRELLSESAILHQVLTRAQVRHILFSLPENATDTQVNSQKKKAEEVKGKMTDLSKFDEFAKEYSDDVASRDKNGEMGATVRGEVAERFSADFESAIFSLPTGQLSDPIRSKYGWHLVIVDKREGENNVSLEEFTNELRAAIGVRTFFGTIESSDQNKPSEGPAQD